jgi:hypothetical protein
MITRFLLAALASISIRSATVVDVRPDLVTFEQSGELYACYYEDTDLAVGDSVRLLMDSRGTADDPTDDEILLVICRSARETKNQPAREMAI